MDINAIVDQGAQESRELEFKHPDVDTADLVKELVALGNSGGGDLIIGIVESDGDIVELHDVGNSSQIEEGVHQHIHQRVDPEFGVAHEVETYSGEFEEYQGSRLLVLTPETGETLHSYENSGASVVFPYRIGTTTAYLNGSKVERFYRIGVSPGRADIDVDSNQPANSSADIESNVTTGSIGRGTEGGGEPEELESTELQLEPSNNPYHFTPATGYGALTFSQLPYFVHPYGIEGSSIMVDLDTLRSIFSALVECFGVDLGRGQFAISQRNAAWFGQGAANFLSALDVNRRYENLPDAFDLDRHHSEGTVFVLNSKIGLVVIRARRGINNNRNLIDGFAVSFCTDGVPVDNRVHEQFLEITDYSLHNAMPIDIRTEQIPFHSEAIQIEPIKLLRSRHDSDFAGWAICPNPFFENPELIENVLEAHNSEFESLTTHERVLCRIKDHHPLTEPHEYVLQRVELTCLTSIQGTIPHANATIWINW